MQKHRSRTSLRHSQPLGMLPVFLTLLLVGGLHATVDEVRVVLEALYHLKPLMHAVCDRQPFLDGSELFLKAAFTIMRQECSLDNDSIPFCPDAVVLSIINGVLGKEFPAWDWLESEYGVTTIMQFFLSEAEEAVSGLLRLQLDSYLTVKNATTGKHLMLLGDFPQLHRAPRRSCMVIMDIDDNTKVQIKSGQVSWTDQLLINFAPLRGNGIFDDSWYEREGITWDDQNEVYLHQHLTHMREYLVIAIQRGDHPDQEEADNSMEKYSNQEVFYPMRLSFRERQVPSDTSDDDEDDDDGEAIQDAPLHFHLTSIIFRGSESSDDHDRDRDHDHYKCIQRVIPNNPSSHAYFAFEEAEWLQSDGSTLSSVTPAQVLSHKRTVELLIYSSTKQIQRNQRLKPLTPPPPPESNLHGKESTIFELVWFSAMFLVFAFVILFTCFALFVLYRKFRTYLKDRRQKYY